MDLPEQLQIWIFDQDEINNRKNLGKSLTQFGYDTASLEDFNFVSGWTDFYIGSGIRLDIITTMVGLENISFEEALNNAAIAQIYDVTVPFLHINQLIQNKKAVNRPKDIIDVMALEKIIKIRDEKS